jgi:hypothetical protein
VWYVGRHSTGRVQSVCRRSVQQLFGQYVALLLIVVHLAQLACLRLFAPAPAAHLGQFPSTGACGSLKPNPWAAASAVCVGNSKPACSSLLVGSFS